MLARPAYQSKFRVKFLLLLIAHTSKNALMHFVKQFGQIIIIQKYEFWSYLHTTDSLFKLTLLESRQQIPSNK